MGLSKKEVRVVVEPVVRRREATTIYRANGHYFASLRSVRKRATSSMTEVDELIRQPRQEEDNERY